MITLVITTKTLHFMTLHTPDLSNVLFIDIETVSQYESFDKLTARQQELWRKKITQTQWFKSEYEKSSAEIIAQSYSKRAGIYAEFGKIVCISVGYIEFKGRQIHSFRLKSFFSDDEPNILDEFVSILTEHYCDPKTHYLCGHNIKEFDIPYLCRRLIINKIKLPKIINVAGQKPWQVSQFIDTLEQWKFGDYKNYTSLDLIANSLGIPSPKIDLDGSQVNSVYYQDGDLRKIVRYCERDVSTVARVFLALKHSIGIDDNQIISTTEGL